MQANSMCIELKRQNYKKLTTVITYNKKVA